MRILIGKRKDSISSEETASTAKIAFWYIIGNLFANGIAMISTPIFTRLLSRSEYGSFTHFTSWENIITVLVTLNFSSSIIRAKYDFEEKMDDYILSILLFSNLTTLIAYFIIELGKPFFTTFFSMDILYIRMLFLYLIFLPAFSYLQLKHRAYKKYKFFVALSISSAAIRTAIAVLLVLTLNNKLFGRICGYLIPITILNIFLWISIIIKGKKPSLHYVAYASKISIPLIPHTLSGILLGNADRIMITTYCGSESNAIYSVAYSVSTLTSLLWTSMNQAWQPWLYDQLAKNQKESITKESKTYLGIFIFLIWGVLLLSPEIIFVFGGKKYYSAKYVMPPIIVGLTFQFIYGMYVNFEIYAKKNFGISIGTTLAAILNLILNRLFIPKFGYIAAAYTTMISFFALYIFHYIIVKKTLKDYAALYNEKFSLLVMLPTIILGGFCLILYSHNLIRCLFLLLYATIFLFGVYKYRNYIYKLLK